MDNKNELTNNNENNLTFFESKKIRKLVYNGEWYYSIVDIVSILTEQFDYQKARKYWNKLKERLIKEEDSEVVTNCHQLKMLAKDGKMRLTDCANRETIFRLIQSIPSPNAEPFKLWFARLAEERIQEINNPSLAIERAKKTYLKKGYSPEWVNSRLRSIDTRNELTGEWKNRGAKTSDYAILTDEISKGTFGITTQKHKDIKGLDKQNLRDNMSNLELALLTLAEATTTELHKTNDSQGVKELKDDAKEGGGIASVTRKNIEKKIKRPVVTSENAIDFINKKKLDK
ncbi:MAG: Bro-N domain-containing protein [Clostridia bacterium]|nr:Bro-N domain-containing protein [Clostridia bacterium]